MARFRTGRLFTVINIDMLIVRRGGAPVDRAELYWYDKSGGCAYLGIGPWRGGLAPYLFYAFRGCSVSRQVRGPLIVFWRVMRLFICSTAAEEDI